MPRNLDFSGGFPFDLERAVVPKQRAPRIVVYVDFNLETGGGVVVPLADVCDPGEKHREAEADDALVEPLLAASQPQTAPRVHREVGINGEMLMGAEIIHDLMARWTVDHVGIKAA